MNAITQTASIADDFYIDYVHIDTFLDLLPSVEDCMELGLVEGLISAHIEKSIDDWEHDHRAMFPRDIIPTIHDKIKGAAWEYQIQRMEDPENDPANYDAGGNYSPRYDADMAYRATDV